MAIRSRLARERDVDGIMSLLTLLYKGDVGEGLREVVREYMSSPNHVVFVAGDECPNDGVLIGSYRLDIDYESRAGFVDALVVRESARGKGIGKLLLRRFTAWAREQNCALLQVINPNVGFFERLGFEERQIRFQQISVEDIKT